VVDKAVADDAGADDDDARGTRLGAHPNLLVAVVAGPGRVAATRET
jgi:hypothetical protein